jgi:hypothetical protein
VIDAGLACLSQTTELVMIGQGKYIDAATTCRVNQLAWREQTIGSGGMAMQVVVHSDINLMNKNNRL